MTAFGQMTTFSLAGAEVPRIGLGTNRLTTDHVTFVRRRRPPHQHRAPELVVGGYAAPRGSRTDLGALLLGYSDDGKLRYAGKVGTGFTRATLYELAAALKPLRRDGSPFADEVRERDVTWVEPELVAQIGFSEWTRDGRLRHPRFLGLRDDKAAREVVREAR